MRHCRPDRQVDRLHEEELDRLEEMSAHNEIAVAAGMYHCQKYEVCPPPWLVKATAKLLIELLKREISSKRGRAGGRIARYRQDLWDFERWCMVHEIRELRRNNKEDREALAALSAQGKLTILGKKYLRNAEKAREWLSQDTYECAAMCLRGGDAYGCPVTVKKSYLRVHAAMRSRSAAHRYHLMFGDFVRQIGLEWPGARKVDTKFVPFYELTL